MVASALVCLALTVYMESRGEPYDGKVAVASVVLNRVEKNDSDICSEVTRPAQFPWARNMIRKTKTGYVIAGRRVPSGEAWRSSLQLADDMLSGDQAIVPRITHFHARYVKPGWHLRRAFAVGRHVFYT